MISALLSSKGRCQMARRRPLLLGSRPEKRLGLGRLFSWDRRHPQRNTLVFRHLAIAVFILSVLAIHTAIRLDVTPPASEGQRELTQTPRCPSGRERRCLAIEEDGGVSCSSVSCSSVSMLIPSVSITNGSLTLERNRTAEC